MSSFLPEPPELADPLAAAPIADDAAPRPSVEGVLITSVGEFMAVPLRAAGGSSDADGGPATAP